MKLLIFLFVIAGSAEGGAPLKRLLHKVANCPKLMGISGLPSRLMSIAAVAARVEVAADPFDVTETIEFEPSGEDTSELKSVFYLAQDDAFTLKEGYDDLLKNFDALPLLNRAIILTRMGLTPDHLTSGLARELVAKKVQTLTKGSDSSANTKRLVEYSYLAAIDFENYLPSVSRLSTADMHASWDELAGKSKTSASKRMHVQDKEGKSTTMPAIVDEGDSPLLAVDVLQRLARLFTNTNRRDLIEHLNQLDWDETRKLVHKIKQKVYLNLFNEGNPQRVKRLDGKVAQSWLDIIFNNYLRFDALRLTVIGSPKHHDFDPKELARTNRLRASVAKMQEIGTMPYSQERGEAMAEKLAEVSNSEYWSFPPQPKISDLENSELGKALLQDLTPPTINALFGITLRLGSEYEQSPVEERLARLDMLADELQALSAPKPMEN